MWQDCVPDAPPLKPRRQLKLSLWQGDCQSRMELNSLLLVFWFVGGGTTPRPFGNASWIQDTLNNTC